MTRRYKKCQHCWVTYTYQASGAGCGARLNDDRHCPDCMEVILKALAKVPVRIETRWIPTDEVSLAELVAEERKPKAEGVLVFRRVWPGLYNLKTGARKEIRAVTMQGVQYRLSTWSEGTEFSIEKEVDFDLKEKRVIGNTQQLP